jgi:hypothetical protein
MWYNMSMEDKERYAHLRTLRTTQQNLRLAAALANKRGIDLLDELVAKELQRLQAERSKQLGTQSI